jgi:hypothetical protein
MHPLRRISHSFKFLSAEPEARKSPYGWKSEEQTSSTDPEDSSGEVNQADINDVQNYENIFKPRRQELNRTPEPIDDFEYELFQPPMSGSESDNNLSRLVHYP